MNADKLNGLFGTDLGRDFYGHIKNALKSGLRVVSLWNTLLTV